MRKALRALFDMYDTAGKVVLALALIGLASSAAMAFFFGVAISLMHGIFLVVVSIGFALGPHLAHKVWLTGARTSAVIIGILCVPLGVVEWYSHNGYTAGLRGVDIGNAKIQQARYTGASNAVDEDQDALTRAKASLDQLKTAHPWAATVTADSLRAQVPAMDEALRQEEKRGGCGPKCLALKEKKANLEAKIATAEERNGIAIRIADLEKRLAGRRTTAATTEFKYSAAEQQAASIAKLFALASTGSLKPTDIQAEVVEQGANVGMSIAAMLQPALFFFIAGFFMVGAIRETNGRPEASEPAPTPIRTMVAQPRRKWRDIYNAQCNTMGIAPVTT